jgi:hypothetical protein
LANIFVSDLLWHWLPEHGSGASVSSECKRVFAIEDTAGFVVNRFAGPEECRRYAEVGWFGEVEFFGREQKPVNLIPNFRRECREP